MQDVCNFIPPQPNNGDLSFLHFVYETNVNKLHQPIVRLNYFMHIVFKGEALLKFREKTYSLKSGDVFFTFPNQSISFETEGVFTFLYISFNGTGAQPLLDSLRITPENFLYRGMEDILPFWMNAVRRINPANANVLTESVLKYTLSFIDNLSDEGAKRPKDKFESILDYLGHNYAVSDMSLKKVADIFFYNEKYFSSLFVKQTGMKFSQYLNELRIAHARQMFQRGETDVAEVAAKCGYTDQFYFSKVFKRFTNQPPGTYLKQMEKLKE